MTTAKPPRIAVAVPVRPDRSRTLTPSPACLINRRRTSPSTGIPLELVERDVLAPLDDGSPACAGAFSRVRTPATARLSRSTSQTPSRSSAVRESARAVLRAHDGADRFAGVAALAVSALALSVGHAHGSIPHRYVTALIADAMWRPRDRRPWSSSISTPRPSSRPGVRLSLDAALWRHCGGHDAGGDLIVFEARSPAPSGPTGSPRRSRASRCERRCPRSPRRRKPGLKSQFTYSVPAVLASGSLERAACTAMCRRRRSGVPGWEHPAHAFRWSRAGRRRDRRRRWSTAGSRRRCPGRRPRRAAGPVPRNGVPTLGRYGDGDHRGAGHRPLDPACPRRRTNSRRSARALRSPVCARRTGIAVQRRVPRCHAGGAPGGTRIPDPPMARRSSGCRPAEPACRSRPKVVTVASQHQYPISSTRQSQCERSTR